jgi:major histocompatibility complex class I
MVLPFGFLNLTLKNFSGQAVVAHAFNPSTWEAESGGFLSLRPAWSTE